MTETAVLLGANESHARDQMTPVAEFETQLANVRENRASWYFAKRKICCILYFEIQTLFRLP